MKGRVFEMKKTLGILSLFVTMCAVGISQAATAKVGPFDIDAKAKLSWAQSKSADLASDNGNTRRNNVPFAASEKFDQANGSFNLDATSNLFKGFNFMGGFAA